MSLPQAREYKDRPTIIVETTTLGFGQCGHLVSCHEPGFNLECIQMLVGERASLKSCKAVVFASFESDTEIPKRAYRGAVTTESVGRMRKLSEPGKL